MTTIKLTENVKNFTNFSCSDGAVFLDSCGLGQAIQNKRRNSSALFFDFARQFSPLKRQFTAGVSQQERIPAGQVF